MPCLYVALLLLAPAGGSPAEAKTFDLRRQLPVSESAMLDELARHDVVFLGEDHDNGVGHRRQLEIFEGLLRQREDVVLSLEMLERDAQGALNDYLAGRIDEAEFLKHARAWPNYQQHYRPLVELARRHKLNVIAANVPRAVAKQVSTGESAGKPSVESPLWMARQTSAPRDGYWDRFQAVMGDHAGTAGPGAMQRYYASQCLKDDTMAESITDFLDRHPHRRPLVVHLCGKFHSDYGQGTVARVLSRRPLLSVGVVTMEAAAEPAEFQPWGCRAAA